MIMNKFFTAEKILPNVTRITGLGGEHAYLIEGEKRALLIDGLTGVGSLKAFVRELTELPVMLAITHGHIDHCGATQALVKMTGAKTFLGAPDKDYVNGVLDLSWAKELGLVLEEFETDVLVNDGDTITVRLEAR